MDEELAPTERTLEQLESVIEQGVQVAEQAAPFLIDMAIAAGEIRERELYKATHRSFDAYCLERWGWSKRKAMSMLAWSRELPSRAETDNQVRRRTSSEVEPPISQRAALKARKQRAIEATATEPDQKDRGQTEPQATLLEPTEKAELAEARKKIAQLEKALDVRLAKPDTALAAKVEALEVENQLLKAELERDDVPPVVTAEGVSADFMTQLAQALEMSVDHPPATLLAKVKALMTERAKRKPAKKAAPEAEPEPASVTPMRPTSPFRPPAPTPSLARREVQPMFKKAR